MNYTQQVKKFKKDYVAKIPKNVQTIMQRATDELTASKKTFSLNVGTKAPNFTLHNHNGIPVTLYEELKKGPVILTFYRGVWCPYCNMELRAYQAILDQLKEQNIQLLAISPQIPDQTLTTHEKNQLQYHVLSDLDDKVSETYRLKFTVPDYMREYYIKFGANLPLYNGNDSWALPIPATYLINKAGEITFTHVNPDYTNRIDSQDILQMIKNK
ncbi:hypothetical protein CN327_30605 [Bacillus cereus]|nr:hypothetical protein CN509_25390 [Bacillus cereus]PES94626.1 hypothetical protein CN505_30750 [Bacillus cereus]PFF26334.1 hypothetical protein CN327_30605 [Bacillus cereus]PFI39030.1 hypothetical protein COI73_30910 [Bacillus cereus]